ncbi:MAG TPA: hypothetical protein VLE99_00985 [Candidatus Saccharimonadales bacterium]|nr:hypothetical protein [Candidatus Saccharimonadales bacterium]
MQIDDLLQEARKIWGDNKLTLEEIVIRMGVVLGDMNRIARTHQETGSINEAELKKEMGNTIFSMIRWCDDLGLDPKECIVMAQQAQQVYVQQHKNAP